MFSRRHLPVILGTLLLVIAAAIGARPAKSDALLERRDGRVVRVDTVDSAATTREVRLPGVTRSVQRAALAFTVPARVVTREVEVGDRVRAGQVLARLDARELELARRSAEAALAEVDARLEQVRRDQMRVERLAAVKAATTEEVEKAQAGTAALTAARQAAEARVAETHRLLGETSLVAPFAGTVTRVKIEPGEWASPGDTVLELSGSDGIEVRVEVSESIRAGVELGAPVRVELPMSGTSVAGHVVTVADASAGAGSLFPVIVALEAAERVVAGMSAEVIVPLAAAPALTVPLAAILDSGSSRPAVFRIEDGQATRIPIRPGRLVGDRLTVSAEGLAAGDLVAVAGHTALVDGDRVDVR